MSRFHSYINSAKEILLNYTGEEPFGSFIKKFFAANKKYGSKDRKQISNLCYCYFRLGQAVATMPVEERILLALFLCSDKQDAMLEALKPEWNEKVDFNFEDKCKTAGISLQPADLFPWIAELSEEIDPKYFVSSFLVQPDLFLRVRPGKFAAVQDKLQKANIVFHKQGDNCLALPNASKIDEVLELNKDVVVQDYSSQRVGEFLNNIESQTSNPTLSVWDCCAASGGKSIMLYDHNNNIDLTVSDIRESILANLRKRFNEAGIKNYKSLVADLSRPISPILNSPFDLIVADVPCSGSGTWSRTPEQLFYFNEEKINEYAALQQRIVANVLPHLKKGGYFLYITCSVFKKENEEMVSSLQGNFQLELTRMKILKGYEKKADTMFAALLRNPL
ncbi:MAG: methyltransferase domain-containing protein [Chitinophagaceae bacterium]|nr:methyltransferase domain-containing protein [Chitinophagaceae bacterium]